MEEIIKRKRKRYTKFNLLETSAVGIGAYPDAHFSLIKALHSLDTSRDSDIVERRKNEMVEEKQESIHSEETSEETKEEVKVEQTETSEEVKEEVKTEEQSEEVAEASEEKTSEDEAKNIADLVAKEVKKVLEEMSSQRGFIEDKKEIPKKSLDFNELASMAWKSAKK